MAELDGQIEALLDEVGTAKLRASYYSRLAMMSFLQNRSRLPVADLSLVYKAMAFAQESGSAPRFAGQQFHLGFHLLWHDRLDEAESALETWSTMWYPLHWLAHWPLLAVALR